MAWDRSWRSWMLVPIGLFAVVIAGNLLMRSVTAKVLYTSPQAIPSVTRTDPSPQWYMAVERTRRIIRASLVEQNLPGLSVAVGVDGGIVWTEGFGWADIETRTPVSPDTRFRIGTASTMLTSAAVGVLREKGRLKLDNEIQTYVPQFPKKRWAVTLRQLMAHVGGVGTDDGNEGPLLNQRCKGPVEALQYFAQEDLLFEPQTQYRHSKYGWILVSAAVEAAARQPFLTFMGEQIFQPLGMANTGAESSTEENPEGIGEPGEDAPFFTFFRHFIAGPLGIGDSTAKPATDPATVYVPGFRFNPLGRYGLNVMHPRNLSCYAGSMAFFSTSSDLVRFGLAIHGGTLLQPATVRLLQTQQQLAGGEETGYGLGWKLDTVTLTGEPMQSAGHDGQLLGQKVVSLVMFRETGMVVAVMSNVSYADTSALALKVAETFAQAARR